MLKVVARSGRSRNVSLLVALLLGLSAIPGVGQAVQRAAAIAGVIVDGDTGNPIPGAKFVVESAK